MKKENYSYVIRHICNGYWGILKKVLITDKNEEFKSQKFPFSNSEIENYKEKYFYQEISVCKRQDIAETISESFIKNDEICISKQYIIFLDKNKWIILLNNESFISGKIIYTTFSECSNFIQAITIIDSLNANSRTVYISYGNEEEIPLKI